MNIDPALLKVPANQLPNLPTPGLALAAPLTIGSAYTFTNAGDQVPMHTHPDGTNHFSIVVGGSVSYDLQNADGTLNSTRYDAGSLFMVPTGVQHGFTGLTAGAQLFNLMAAIADPATIQAAVQALNAQILALQTLLTNVLNLTA